MNKFSYGASSVTAQVLTGGILCEAVYGGPITHEAFYLLRDELNRTIASCDAFVIRLDQSLIVMADIPEPTCTNNLASPARAFIVRPEQFEFWQNYALQGARSGIVRTVWKSSNANLAYEWALRRSCLYSEELQH